MATGRSAASSDGRNTPAVAAGTSRLSGLVEARRRRLVARTHGAHTDTGTGYLVIGRPFPGCETGIAACRLEPAGKGSGVPAPSVVGPLPSRSGTGTDAGGRDVAMSPLGTSVGLRRSVRCGLVRLLLPEHVLRDEVENHLAGHGGDPPRADAAEHGGNPVLGGHAVAAVRLNRGIHGEPCGLG